MNRWLASAPPLVALLLATAPAAAVEPPPNPADGPGRDETDAVLETRSDAHAASGVTIDVRMSLLVPAGQYFDAAGVGMDSFGPGSAVAIALGFHPLRHFGFLVGARGSFGHAGTDACSATAGADASCGGYSVQLPVMIELDEIDRLRGFFVQGGVGLFTRYTAYGDGGTMSFTNDFAEYKAAVGWRHPFDPGEARNPRMGIELFVGADFGQFASAEFHDSTGVTAGAIDAPAWHYVVEIGAGIHFTP